MDRVKCIYWCFSAYVYMYVLIYEMLVCARDEDHPPPLTHLSVYLDNINLFWTPQLVLFVVKNTAFDAVTMIMIINVCL